MSTIAVPKQVNKAVKSEIYDALRDGLTKPTGKSKKSWSQGFIEQMLNEAKKNPNGPLGQMIARQIMQDDIISQLDSATDKYLSRDIDFNEYRIRKTLYDKQQVVFDESLAKRIVCICSRRVGKSELAARLLLKDALQPNHHAIYFALKFDAAIRQCFVIVEALAQSLGLPIVQSSKADGHIIFANGSDITFRGNSNKAEADKNLGFKFSLAILDEIQNQCQPQYLVDTVLGPALKDYDGQLVLLGTPPRIPHTYAEKVWKDYDGWKKYSWTMHDNPYIKNVEEYINQLCKEKGCTRDAPFIQREYYAGWVWDKEAQVFKDVLFYQGDNDYVLNEIKAGRFKADYIYGGVDFGFSDYNAIVAIAWDRNKQMGYVLRNYKFNKATVTEIVEKMKIALAEGQEILIASYTDPHNMMFYGDTSDKSIIFELQTNYNFPIQCAYKHDKMEALSVLAELARRKIYTPKGSPLADEYDMLVYKRDEETDAILPELDDDLFHGDSSMAFLYASRSLVLDYNPLGKEDGAIETDQGIIEEGLPDDSYLTPDGTYSNVNTNNIEEY